MAVEKSFKWRLISYNNNNNSFTIPIDISTDIPAFN